MASSAAASIPAAVCRMVFKLAPSGLPAGAGRILRTGIECSPCRERLCQRRECLERLGPELVAATLDAS